MSAGELKEAEEVLDVICPLSDEATGGMTMGKVPATRLQIV